MTPTPQELAAARELLDVKRSALPPELGRAFRTKAFEVHPDRNHAPDATEQFQRLAAAYELLLEQFAQEESTQASGEWKPSEELLRGREYLRNLMRQYGPPSAPVNKQDLFRRIVDAQRAQSRPTSTYEQLVAEEAATRSAVGPTGIELPPAPVTRGHENAPSSNAAAPDPRLSVEIPPLPTPAQLRQMKARRDQVKAELDAATAVKKKERAAEKAALEKAAALAAGKGFAGRSVEQEARRAIREAEHPQASVGKEDEDRPKYFKCKGVTGEPCGAVVRLKGGVIIPDHRRHGSRKSCRMSGKECLQGLSSLSAIAYSLAATGDPKVLEWLQEMAIVGRCPEAQHATIQVSPELCDIWEAAGVELSAKEREWWERRSAEEVLQLYPACTSWAMRAPVCLVGGCNDEYSTEKRSGNEWGYALDAMIFNRGPRSWGDYAPRTRRTAVGGDRAGTYSGRHPRACFAQLFDDTSAVRREVKVGRPIKSRRQGKRAAYPSTNVEFENRFVKSRLYLTCEALQTVKHEPACRALVRAIRHVCRPKKQGGAGHAWLYAATERARQARVGKFEDSILPVSDRKAATRARAIRRSYARRPSKTPRNQASLPIKGPYGKPVRARRSGPDGTGLISGASAPAAGNSGTDPPS